MGRSPSMTPKRASAAIIINIKIAEIFRIANKFSNLFNTFTPINKTTSPKKAYPDANTHNGTLGNQKREKIDNAVIWLPIMSNSEHQYTHPLLNPAHLPYAFLAYVRKPPFCGS